MGRLKGEWRGKGGRKGGEGGIAIALLVVGSCSRALCGHTEG